MSNQQATMICMDCSEYMRNGDYTPNRFEAQREAVHLIMGTKINANPENVVGIMSAGGKRPELLATLTSDSAKLLTVIHRAHEKISGSSDLLSAIELARLALKHRAKKPQQPRMILFVGSPIPSDTSRKLVRLGSVLRKENVAVDVICFGDYPENNEVLEKFVGASNSNDNSSFISVKVGQDIKETVRSSSMLGTGASASVGGFGEEEDPDILLAIQRSLEEQRSREGGDESAGTTTTPIEEEDDEERALREAMELSKEAAGTTETKSFDEMTEEEQMALAMQMSLDSTGAEEPKTTETKEEKEPPKESKEPVAEAKTETTAGTSHEESVDRDFVNSVLQSLPGVDISDPAIQGILSSLDKGDTDMKEKEEEHEEDEDIQAALALSMQLMKEEDEASKKTDEEKDK